MKASGVIIIEFNIETKSIQKLTLDTLAIDPLDTTKIYWIHCDLNHIKAYNLAAKKLKLPREVKTLCKQTEVLPQLFDMDETVTLQIQCVLSTALAPNEEPHFGNLIIHLSSRYCFTASREDIPAIKDFLLTHPKAIQFAKTPCFILFLICDYVIDFYSKILFNEELITDEMEIGIHKLHKNIYQDVIDLKQQVMKLKRNIISIREMLTRISDRKISVISEPCRESLHHLSNHCHMLINEADSMRDVLKDLLAQIDNALMQGLNETMRILTAFAAIFLPLSLITGIYGMNFETMPELHWKYGYFYALSLLLFCGLLLLFIFKKKKWF